ncbi:MAG: cytochrome C oxidase subunit IV family protein [Chitinophagales bacterium]|nr:cytochrome C oxidase subunit IV family protein [Chitinophagales bacterium]
MSRGHVPSDAEYKSQVSAVWKATFWMGLITIVEVVIALIWMKYLTDYPRIILNSFFIVASATKAFFIIGEFMHLKYEKRALMISMAVPLIFLVWAIIAFSWEGGAWHHMRGY